MYNGTEIGTALAALGNSILTWELVHVVGALDATLFDAVDLKVAGFIAAGKYHAWIGSTRMPTIAEAESAYKVALDTIFSAPQAPLTRTVTLLGQRVTLRIRPTRWVWEYGDGHSATTTTGGTRPPPPSPRRSRSAFGKHATTTASRSAGPPAPSRQAAWPRGR